MSEEIPKWKLAFEDYQKGLKYKDIAEKYEVSISAIKSWKSRYWTTEKLQPNGKKVATKKIKSCNQNKGGQKGNKNAVGGGAPKGNKNNLKHGAYATYFHDLLDPQILEALNSENYLTAKEEYEKELRDLRLRKLHLQQQIRDIIHKYSDTGVSTNSVINTVNYKGNKETSSQIQEIKEGTQALLTPLQTELTKVQKAIIKVIELISKLEDSTSSELDKLDEILSQIKKSAET